MADESAKRCIEVGAAPRAALVAVANFRVAGGGLGWQVAARFRPQPLTARSIAAVGRDDRPGHPWSRHRRAPTQYPRDFSGLKAAWVYYD
jgi:hypothetical protein